MEIATKYARLGGRHSLLGAPVGVEQENPDREGRRQEYQNGFIYFLRGTGAFYILKGAVWNRWESERWEQGRLGYPTSDPVRFGGLYRQYFQGGIVVSDGADLSPTSDFKAIAIFSNTIMPGWTEGAGFIGRVVSEEIINPDGGGVRQEFEAGMVYWHEDAGSHPVAFGPIWEKWKELGWEQGPLGYPTSRQQRSRRSSSVTEQRFQNGRIEAYENRCVASTSTGEILPLRRYRLSLDRLEVLRETPGVLAFGSDEVKFRFVLNLPGDSRIVNYQSENLDTGDVRTPDLTLYEGNAPTGFTLALLGLEYENERLANEALDRFSAETERTLSSVLDVGEEPPSEADILGDVLSGAVAGGVFLPIALGEVTWVGFTAGPAGPAIAASGIVVSGGTILIGMAAGAAIVGLYQLGNTLFWEGEKPDPIAVDLRVTSVPRLLEFFETRTRVFAASSIDLGDGISVNTSFEWDENGDLLEVRWYRSARESSDYVVRLRHHFS